MAWSGLALLNLPSLRHSSELALALPGLGPDSSGQFLSLANDGQIQGSTQAS